MKQIIIKCFAVAAMAISPAITILAQNSVEILQKGYRIILPHDNLYLGKQYFVVYDSIRPDGSRDTYITHDWVYTGWERFQNTVEGAYGYFEGEYFVDDEIVYYHYYNDDISMLTSSYKRDVTSLDMCRYTSWKIGVPDIEKVCVDVDIDPEEYGVIPNGWEDYHIFGANPAEHFNPENPKDAWYMTDYERDKTDYICYGNIDGYSPGYYPFIANVTRTGFFYDEFLYIDGQLVDFTEYQPVVYRDIRVEYTTIDNPHGPGTVPAKVFTFDLEQKHVDRNFGAIVIDTIYQYTPSMTIAPSNSRAVEQMPRLPRLPRERVNRVYPVNEMPNKSMSQPLNAVRVRNEE